MHMSTTVYKTKRYSQLSALPINSQVTSSNKNQQHSNYQVQVNGESLKLFLSVGSVCACSSSYTREEAKHCLPSFSQTSSFCEICSPPAPAQSEEYCDILRAISAGEFFFHIFNLRTRQHFKALQPRTTSIYYNYGPSTRAGHALQIKRTTGQGRKHAALCTVTVAKGTQTRTLISTGTPSSSSLVNKHKVSGRMNRGIQQMDDMMPKK